MANSPLALAGEETGDDYFGTATQGAGGLSALDVPGAAQALERMARSSEQARAALQRAREQISARRYNKALPWFEIAGALSKPTATGSIGETFGNLAGALAGPIREREAFKREQEKELLGIDKEIAGLDRGDADAQMKLAILQAQMAGERSRGPVQEVILPTGEIAYRYNEEAVAPGMRAYVKPPAGQQTYSIVQQPQPDGTTRPMRLNHRTGELTPAGEAYTPVTKLSASQIAQTKAKLGTIRVLKSQLAAMRAKWEPIKGTMSAGYLQGWIPTETGKQFDKAVDAARGTIRQLTRTPGEGSMSNYEGQLDQAKLPIRGEYEAASEDAMTYLEQLVKDYESSALEVLGMPMPKTPASPASAAPAAPAPAAPPKTAEGEEAPDVPVFNNEADAKAARDRDEIQPGSIIMVNGVVGTWEDE